MLDARSGRTIVAWETEIPEELICDREADNWVIDWLGEETDDSAWATVDDRRDDPDAAFRVFPVYFNNELIPDGASCSTCGAMWNGRDWVSESEWLGETP